MKKNVIIASLFLITRLDNTFILIGQAGNQNEGDAELQAQAILYATFLSDIANGGIAAEGEVVSEMIDLIKDFCKLIEARKNN